MGYQQLSHEDRYHIYGLRQAGFNQIEIAAQLNVNKSTISREIKRNVGERGYRPKQAQAKSDDRRTSAAKAIKFTEDIHDIVVIYILERWSPEQIAGWLKKEGLADISHERIYQFVWDDKANGGDLYSNLRQGARKRRAKYGKKSSTRGQIKNRTSISDRPSEVDEKVRVGDWEGDTITSRKSKSVIVTFVERKTKVALLKKVDNKSAEAIGSAIIEMLTPYKKDVHTITFDNGKEFANHESISTQLEADVYFADPYSSWQRGVNENTNGLIRQFFPKKTDFAKVDETMITEVQDKLNSRPRKTLDFQAPSDIFKLKNYFNKVALIN
jgi:IS30 family transposase